MSKILVVEDTPASMRLMVTVLEKGGYQALQAWNALDGIDLAKEEQPALILMDVHLPGMSGLEAVQQLRADPLTKDIPIIAVTAFAMIGDRERFIAAGCSDYCAKPVRYKEMLDLVEKVLHSSKGQESQ